MCGFCEFVRYHKHMKTNGKRKSKAASVAFIDLSAQSSVEAFRKEAKSFTAKATQSKARAIAILSAEGIYTKSGALTRTYR
jgi:hypothetical protein